MRKIKRLCGIIFLLSIICIENACFAVDQFRAFKTWDYEAEDIGESSAAAVNNAVGYGVLNFQKLGYINADGTNCITNTGSKEYLLNNWINLSSNNYGFYIYAHGSSSVFALENGNSNEYVSPSEISGNWHLVFLDSCSCQATNSFATAFNTVGYSNRATLGWYTTVSHQGSAEWWEHFYPIVGTTNLRSACLAAADQCELSTPIRMYGDTSWDGSAWK